MNIPTSLTGPAPAERDNCQVCLGLRGGVPGNENRCAGLCICDYCSARKPGFAVGTVSASDVAVKQFALTEQLKILRRTLGATSIPPEAEHLMRQMSGFLESLGSLPVMALTLPWTKVVDSLPRPMDQIFAMGVDGKVHDISGVMLLPDEGFAGDDPGERYTHWTLKPGAANASSEINLG